MSHYSKIATLLYVEDEEDVRKDYESVLNHHAKELYIASNGKKGLELFIKYQPDIVITNISMPMMNGIDLSRAIKKINPEQQIIITTAHSETDYFMEAIDLQISAYLLKPVDKNLLTKKILEIAKHHKLNDELYAQQALMKEIANLQNNMLIVYDADNRIIFANTAFLHFFNIKKINDFVEKVGRLSNCFIKKEDSFFYAHSSNNHWTHEIEQLDEDKRLVSMSNLPLQNTFSGNKIPIEETFLINIKQVAINNHKICTFSKITSITTQKSEFEIKAYIDELTQIPNRARFNQVLHKEIERYQRYNQEFSLIILDIDHFKRFNDIHGHQTGDDILRDLSQLIKNRIRTTDLFARWGGEEFVIVLTNTLIDAAHSFAESIRVSIEDYNFKNNLKLTCSFGVTVITQGDYEELIFQRADAALYQAKKDGRNRVISRIT